MMELSNFEHLKNYPDVYEKCITDEKSLIEAYDLHNPNKTQLITIAGAMRGGLYGIVKHMIKQMNITDDMVRKFKHSHNMPSPDRVDNFGKLRILEEKGAFDRTVADIAHRIRKIGNDANHFMEGQESMFDKLSPQETLKVVEEMYEKLYYFSHYFIDVFLTKNSYVAESKNNSVNFGRSYNESVSGMSSNNSSSKGKNKKDTMRTAIISGIIFVICVLIIVGSM